MFCHKCLVHGHVATDCNKDDAAYEIELTTKVEASIKENCGLRDAWGMLETERPEKLHHFTPGRKTYWSDGELAIRRANKAEQLALRQVIVNKIRTSLGATAEP